MDKIIALALIGLISEILGTIGGFGSSMFFVPLSAYFFSFQTILGVTALFHVFSNINKIVFFKKGFDKRLILYLGIGAVLSNYLNAKILELILSIFLIVLSGIVLIFPNIKINPDNKNAVIGGIFSGVLAGLLGTGGAVRGLVLASFNLSRDVFIASSAIIDLGIDISRSVVYISQGYLPKESWIYIPVLIIVSILGTWIGKKILEKIDEKYFKKMVLGLILTTGIISLFRISGV